MNFILSLQKKVVFCLLLLLTWVIITPALHPAFAQVACTFYPVSPALTDLGTNEYQRLTSINPPTYIPTGIIGGLYPGGSNVRPAEHKATGIALAQTIVPLDTNGNPNPNGRIGMASLGMSNTQTDFGRFKSLADADPAVHDRLRFANGAISGGVIDIWVDPTNPQYEQYWTFFDQQITNYGLTLPQVQVIWVKITQYQYMPNFPADMQALTNMYAELARLIKARLPNLKITYFSSRTRSFNYFSGLAAETTAFENGFAVRWLIEKQLNGDMSLNYDPAKGPVTASYITWGPYLWIDGLNARNDGKVWPLSMVNSRDCTHPSTEGATYVANMMLEYFKSDATSTPWFLNPGVPTPTPTQPTTPTPTPTPTEGPTPTPTAIPTPTNTPTPTATPTPTNTPTPTPTPGAFNPISSWGFGSNGVTDDINGCSGCVNNGATWFTPSIISGGYNFDGVNAYLNLGTFPYLNNASAFTLSAWVRPDFDQNHTVWRHIFNDGANVALYFLSNNRDWRFSVRTLSKTYFVDTQGLTWTPGTWHMISGTYDGSTIKLYWDGQLAGSKAATGAIAADSGATYLGTSAIRTNKFDGVIDELRIYNISLSDSEVNQLYLNL